MLLSEMIKTCKELLDSHGDLKITILDGYNGGGIPRTITLKPQVFDTGSITSYFFEDELDLLNKINTNVGNIVIIGSGNY